MDMKLELVPIPVTDADRAKAFYADQVGFHVDLDERFGETFRVIQLTPPGSACSICIGTGIVDTPRLGPGPAPGGGRHPRHPGRAPGPRRRDQRGPGDDRPGKPSVFYAYFKDPDGNGWALQQLPY